MKSKSRILRFPDNFLFGTATAAHQIEGDNVNSDWWQWEQNGKVCEKSGKACDSWNRWKEDIDLAKSLNTNVYRFSIEWSRIEPEEGKFNIEVLKHYEEQIKYLHKLRMKANVTLWHFTLPLWFAKKGGFTKKQNLSCFSNFVNYVLDNLTEFPDSWILMNEPNTYIARSYLNGDWPPGFTNRYYLLPLVINLAQVNKVVYKMIHQKIKNTTVGNCYHFVCFEYFGKNPMFKLVRWLLNLINNELTVIFTKSSMDFIGVNYYIVHVISWRDLLPKKIFVNKKDEQNLILGKKNDIGWNIYPQGIYKILTNLKKFNLPIYITEVGVADKNDILRGFYILDTLEWVYAAIKENVDVRGFSYWSLLDNFEWALGTIPKFGLFETNFETFERKARPSAQTYAKICKEKALVLG